MPLDALDVSALIPASPDRIFASWLDGAGHAAMTGSPATGEARVGAAFTCWDGYIRGTNLELVPHARIVQAWRTSQFTASDADSRLEVLLAPESGGTRVRLVHTHIPAGQGSSYEKGWEEFYFAPMRAFFAG